MTMHATLERYRTTSERLARARRERKAEMIRHAEVRMRGEIIAAQRRISEAAIAQRSGDRTNARTSPVITGIVYHDDSSGGFFSE